MSRTGWSSLALLALLCGSAPAHALDPAKPFADFARDNWSAEQGLPQITVLSFAQGPEGYLWIGTQGGLARFDGVQFHNFQPDDVPALPGLWVQSMLFDSRGRLWIGTYKGLAWHAAGRFFTVHNTTNQAQEIRALAELPGGVIAAATPDGLALVHGDSLDADPAIPRTPLYDLLARGGALYAGAADKVYVRTAHAVTVLPLPASEHGTLVLHLIQQKSVLWAGTSHGLFRYIDGAWSRFTLPAALDTLPVSALYADSDGTLWVATITGLVRIYEERVTEVIPADATGGQVESIFEDREHNLWFGTRANGMFRLWNGFIERLSTSYGLSEPVAWALAPGTDDSWWVGTSNGLEHFEHGHFALAAAGSKLPNPNAYTLLADGERIWIGTRTGVAVYEHGRISTPAVFAPMAAAQVSGILRDGEGDYWFATTTGLYRYSHASLEHFGPEQGLSEIRCRVLFAGGGRLLVGTVNGLFAYSQGQLQRVAGLPANIDVTAIAALRDGTLVAGTVAENGLYVQQKDAWTHIGTAEGLPGNGVFSIQQDAQGYVWVAGSRGIYRVQARELTGVASGRQKTLQAQGVLSDQGQWPGSQVGHCCNGAGNGRGLLIGDELLLPSREGVVKINTRKPRFNTVPPTTVVEAIQFGEQWHEVLPDEQLTLPAPHRDIAIRFTALSFQYPAGVMLRYRLLGYDAAWKDLPDARLRTVFYTNLPPGSYTFEAEGANNAGVWSRDTARLEFGIRYYFYETWWFKALVVLVALVLVLGLFRFQVRNLRFRQLQLERTVQQRTAELREANARLEEASQTDPLTGARNRRYLANQLPGDIALFRREFAANPELRMVFALMDLDHFKSINDTYGHTSGDRALVEFADLLKSTIRQGDYLVRWGGEEFLVVLRSVHYDEVASYAERLSKAVQRYRFATPDDRTLRLTCSLGFAEFPFYPEDPDALDWNNAIVLADRAMYSIKQSGRNGWAVVRPVAGVPAAKLKQNFSQGLNWLVEHHLLKLITHRHGAGEA